MRMPGGRVRAVRLGLGTALLVLAATGAVAAVIAQSDDDELVAIGTPRVVLTSPLPGAPYAAPASITLGAIATVPSGTIQKVDFFRDSTLVDSDAAAPYGYVWSSIPAGVYNVTARARSSFGITGTSLSVQVRVCDVPTTSVSSPAPGATLATGVPATLQANAGSPNDGCTIGKVEFYAQLGAGTPVLVGMALGQAPYQISWTPGSSGSYTLTTKVFDQRDVTATSAGVAVVVNASPTVSIGAPSSNQVFAPGSTIAITAAPTDADGTISRVEFYQGTTLIGSKTSAPWTYNWTGAAKGNYSLSAKAFDDLNAVGTSAAVPIVVSQPPTVSITAPASGAVFANPANITISATASDPDGTIARVEFYQGSTLICTDTSSPFSCAWNGVAGGSYSLTAKATDDQGATTTSAAVPIIVNQLPVVSLTSPAGGNTFAAPATVSLAATATDPDGTIAEVRFYAGASLLATDAASPYAHSWTPVSAGAYSLTAVAVDNRGATMTSAPVAVTVCGPPSVSLTSPSGGTYATPATIQLSAGASSACGIQNLEFYDGASLIATDTAAPYDQTWANVTVTGAHTVKARAYDNLGQFTDAQTTVQVVSNTQPAINGVTPAAAQVISGGAVSFYVTVTDPDSGNTLTVTLWNGTTLLATLGPVGSGTHVLTWTPPAAGIYNLTVQVADPYAAATQPVTVEAVAAPTSATPAPDAVIPGSYPTPAIGTLAGTFAVSESGAATWAIPLKVAPGTAGMEPSLSLNYSSQGGYGQLGVGFALGGLSTIARCPMNEAQDGKTAAINYDTDETNDRWCLDGQRLVPVGAKVAVTDDVFGNAAERQEYRTELEGYARIESFEEAIPLALAGPYRFRVTTKAGQIMEFGSRWWVVTAGWMQSGVNGLGPLRGNSTKVFVLDRVLDRAGNFIDIDYADRMYAQFPGDDSKWNNVLRMVPSCGDGLLAGEVEPRPIGAFPNVEYWVTGMRYYAAGSDPCYSDNNQVVFNYQDIPSQAAYSARNRYYGQGAGQTSISRQLVSVEMRSDAPAQGTGTLVRRYELGYATSAQTGRELVSSIRECGADGTCLPSTTFNWASETWNATGKQFATTTLAAGTLPFGLTLASAGNNGVYVGDWDGDGRSDLVGWQNTDLGNGFWQHDLRVCLSTGSGFACGAPILSDSDSSPTPSVHIEVMDIDNDGRVDLVRRLNGFSTWALCRSTGGTTCTAVPGTWITKPQNDGTQPNYRGDFDGDGRIDFITWYDDQQFETCLTRDSVFACATHDLQIYDPAPQTIPANEAFYTENAKFQILVADVNGDGRADLVRRRDSNESNNEWKVCFSTFSRDGTGGWNCHAEFIKGPVGKIENSLTYDFNGDGLADAANFDSANKTLVCLSTGDGAFEFRDVNVHWDPNTNQYVKADGTSVNYYADDRCRLWNSPSIGGADKITFGDFNGDGRTDLIAWVGGANPWQVCLSNGSEFVCSNWPGPAITAPNPDLNQQIVAGDFDGDGRTDILYMPDGLATPRLGLSAGPGAADAIVKVTTGLGAVTEVTYKPLTDATVYAKGSGADKARQELDIQSPMYLVQRVAASTGNAPSERFATEYFYENLRGRTSGRGLYGFAKVRSRDGVGIVTETEFTRPAGGVDTYASRWAEVGRTSVVRKYAPTAAGYSADITDVAAFNGAATLFGGSLRLVNRSQNTWESRISQTCNGANCTPVVSTPPHPSVYQAHLTQSVEESFELDGSALASTTTSMPLGSINAYGNPTTVSVVTTDASGGYSKVTTNTYAAANTTSWVVDRLLNSVVTSSKPGGAAVTRKSSFTHKGIAGGNCSGAALGQLCSETIEPDRANESGSAYSLWQQTAYGYDGFGNRTSSAVTFKERDGTQVTRTTTTGYDARGRFATSTTLPTSTQNPIALTQTRSFDSRFGIATTQTDANGVSTTKLLDGFGRVYGERAYNAAGQKIAESYAPVEATGIAGYEKYRQRQVASGGGTVEVYFDELQREVRRKGKAFIDGTYATTTLAYDAAGRKSSATKPAGGGMVSTSWTYDTLNRLASETMTATGLTLTSSYAYGVTPSLAVDGATVGPLKSVSITQTGTGIASRTSVRHSNSQGQTVRVTDGLGNNTDFVYDAIGNLTKATGPTGIAEVMGYDLRGRKLSLTNPDSGSWSYEYNGAGELVRQTDAKGQVTRNFYDSLGRLVERREHPGSEAATPFVTVTSYDRYADTSACAFGKGKACEVRTGTVTRVSVGGQLASPQVRQFTAFDNAGRATTGTTQFEGRSFVSTTSFDANGRVDKLQYPSGYTVVHRYTSWTGALDRVAEWTGTTTGQVHWTATARYPDGQAGTSIVGSTNLARNYDGLGRVSDIAAGVGGNPVSLANAHYTFDALGNLTQRSESVLNPATQSFGYDAVDRLTSYAGQSASYDAAGNLQARAGTSYNYQAGSHRMTAAGSTGYGYDANGNVTSISGGTTRTITPTAFNLPSTIVQGTTSLAYVYDGGHRRIKETSATAAGTTTTWYLGSYEEITRTDGITERRHWIATPDGPAGIYTSRSDGTTAPRYWLTDHLGSVVGEVDQTGALKQSASFGAWGDRAQVLQADSRAEDRGFTGHEHLTEVNLVHMNGRVYDPVTGRFLAADPLIQDPYDAQSYNRYSYVRNNPLSFTDPSGYSWWTKWRKPIAAIAVAAITMGATTWAMGAYALEIGSSTGFATLAGATETGTVITGFGNATAAVASGFASGGISGGNIESAIAGAVSAGAFFAAGSIAGAATDIGIGGFGQGEAGRVALHAVAGCASGAAAGGSCGRQAAAGAFSEAAGPIIAAGGDQFAYRVVAHSVAGGLGSMAAGGKFENGAVTGAFGYLFNQIAHPAMASLAQGGAAVRGGLLSVALSLAGDTQQEYLYVTYYRYNDATGEVYAGRTGGYGDPETIVRLRASSQTQLNYEGFGRPQVDGVSTDLGAIRGREQQLIDMFGGARSVGGFARNSINGVADLNPFRPYYMNAARIAFGNLPDNSPPRYRFGD